MFSADPYVMEFIKGNWLSLSMLLALLKGLAVLTVSVHDDKVVTLLQRVFGMAGLGSGLGEKAKNVPTTPVDHSLR